MLIIDLINNTTYTVQDKNEVIDLTVRRSSRKRKKPDRFNYDDRLKKSLK